MCNLLRIAGAVCLLFTTACGLIPDSQDDEDKLIFINIPDRAFEKACLAACDIDGDGRVSRYEARRLLYLSCPDAGIQSVDGIAEFVQLRTFDCARNQISSINLNRNLSLQKLDCSDNRISFLDIKGLQSLTELNCSGNQLSQLDLLRDSALSTINCARNQLVTLDISPCAQEITLLDARENPQLGVIYVAASQTVVSQQIDGQTQIVVNQ